MTLHIDMLYLFFNFTGLRIFFFGEGWDRNNAATSRHHFLVVVVVVVVRVRGWVGGWGVNSGKKILSLIEKNKNKTKPRKPRKKICKLYRASFYSVYGQATENECSPDSWIPVLCVLGYFDGWSPGPVYLQRAQAVLL